MPLRRIADLVLESATDYAIITSDLKGRVTFWNRGAAKILGWTEDEMLGNSADRIFTPEDRIRRLPELEMGEALSQGRSADERWHLRKDGSEFWASGEMLPLQDGGEPEGFLKILRDRTGEWLVEDRVRESETRLALATEAANIGIWDWDLTTGILAYSVRAKLLCGFPPDHEFTFQDAQSIVHPEDLPKTTAMSKRALDPAIRERIPYEYRIIRPDGELRWLLAHGDAVFAEEGGEVRAVRYLGTLQDVTARRHLEEHLQASRSRLALAISAGKMAVWELDFASEFLTTSSELNALLGFPADATPTPEEIRARYYPGDREKLRELAFTALKNDEAFIEMEFRYLWPDGSAHWLLLRAEFVFDESGQPYRMVGILMDIDARKRSQELQSVLNHELNHRLKNQLALVQGIVSQSLRNVTSAEQARDVIITRLGVLARAHDLVVAGLQQKADLGDIVRNAVHLHEDGNSSRFALDGPTVEVGPRAALSLALIIHELATNAVKYGALSAIGGQVLIIWRLLPGPDAETLELVWEERNGPTVVAPLSHGFGSRLVKGGIAGTSSRVEVEYLPRGVKCTIAVALAELTTDL